MMQKCEFALRDFYYLLHTIPSYWYLQAVREPVFLESRRAIYNIVNDFILNAS